MAEHTAFPVHASHSAFGGTVASAPLDGREVLSQPVKSNTRKSIERMMSLPTASRHYTGEERFLRIWTIAMVSTVSPFWLTIRYPMRKVPRSGFDVDGRTSSTSASV